MIVFECFLFGTVSFCFMQIASVLVCFFVIFIYIYIVVLFCSFFRAYIFVCYFCELVVMSNWRYPFGFTSGGFFQWSGIFAAMKLFSFGGFLPTIYLDRWLPSLSCSPPPSLLLIVVRPLRFIFGGHSALSAVYYIWLRTH